MSPTAETLFDLLLNSTLQAALFALLAAAFSRLIARARPKHQFFTYLAVLLFCIAFPAINTFWHFGTRASVGTFPQREVTAAQEMNRRFWIWQEHARQQGQIVPPAFQNWILGAWGVFVVLRLIRFGRAVYRVRQLRRDASPLPAEFGRILLLESADINVPVTIGMFHPAILLPISLRAKLSQEELSAILEHECGHIRRRDFSIHMLCEIFSLPVAWHPGVRYLMSKISETRELACDELAAARLGKRSYAQTLVTLASLCLEVPRGNAVALSIFDGDNLETRIMMLTKKQLSFSRTRAIALALAMGVTFSAGALLAQTMSFQASSKASRTSEKFAGTWHWMFEGRSFSTMILTRSGAGFTGSITESRIALNDEGGLLHADPSEDTTPKTIAKGKLEGSTLRVMVSDGFEFIVTLTDDTHAEIRPVGAPSNMKPIIAEKVR